MRRSLLFLALSCLIYSAPDAWGQRLVVVKPGGSLHIVDGGTGCEIGMLAVGNTSEVNALARRPSDGHYFLAGGWSAIVVPELYEVDVDGTLLSTTIMNGLQSVRGMAFDDQGTLYVIDGVAGSDTLWIWDIVAQAPIYVGATGFLGIQALCWDSQGQRLLGFDVGGGVGAALLSIDPVTGVATDLDPNYSSVTAWDCQGLMMDAAGNLWSSGQYITRLDPASGAPIWTGPCQVYGRGIEVLDGFDLTVNGGCGGLVTVHLYGGSPNGLAALAWAPYVGPTIVQAGPCGPLLLGIGPAPALVGTRTLDAEGDAAFAPQSVPAAACGVANLQAVDLGSCAVTSVFHL